MRNLLLTAAAALSLVLGASAQSIQGEYIESRNADVYTGQCFANGEVNLVGDTAVLGWNIERGSWDGVKLDGLAVAAAVKAKATLGDPYANPYPAQSVLIVDDRATPEQREALVAFAKHAGGELLKNVVRTEYAPVVFDMPQNHHQHGRAIMRAGTLATVATRPIGGNDHLCGNEVTFYPPLTKLSHAVPAVALTDEFNGQGLGTDWSLHDKRSAFLGRFELGENMTAEVHHQH
jgi:hypothetical protein